jgi:hypothetical protein
MEITPGPKQLKEEEMTSEQKAEAWLASQKSSAWEHGVTGDFTNIVNGPIMQCEAEPLWPRIKPIRTVEQYIQNRWALTGTQDASEIAAAAISQTNSEFLVKANAIVAEMNVIIGDGVKTKEQADTLTKRGYEFVALVREGRG